MRSPLGTAKRAVVAHVCPQATDADLVFAWCPGEDSNLHGFHHWYLKPARLPIPPPGLADLGKAAGFALSNRPSAAAAAAPLYRECPILYCARGAPGRRAPVTQELKGMITQANVDTLVTVFGGSGFLGRHVVRALCRRGYRVRVAVR